MSHPFGVSQNSPALVPDTPGRSVKRILQWRWLIAHRALGVVRPRTPVTFTGVWDDSASRRYYDSELETRVGRPAGKERDDRIEWFISTCRD